MKILTASVASVAVAACASMSLLLWPGIAVADPDVVGMTYSDAKAAFSQASLTPIVATTVGDRLPLNECYVVSTSRTTFFDQTTGSSTQNRIMVNLNCYPKGATALNPGFSAGNNAPDAAAVRDTSEQDALEWKQTAQGQRWCARAQEQHPEWGNIEGCAVAG
jgi:hypothetical protein